MHCRQFQQLRSLTVPAGDGGGFMNIKPLSAFLSRSKVITAIHESGIQIIKQTKFMLSRMRIPQKRQQFGDTAAAAEFQATAQAKTGISGCQPGTKEAMAE